MHLASQKAGTTMLISINEAEHMVSSQYYAAGPMATAKKLRLLQIIMTLGLHKYILAGTINTAIGIAVIVAAFKLTQSPTLTIGISAGLGYLYSLLTYHYLAFDGKGLRPPYKRYAIIFGSAFILNAGTTTVLIKYVHGFIGAQIIILPLIIVGQWLASKFWVFEKKRIHNNSSH